ncbi:SH2 domain-containing protein [Blastocladiella britannica]|nr:SH2 domain-containing protein [Blastocladiella britannica]
MEDSEEEPDDIDEENDEDRGFLVDDEEDDGEGGHRHRRRHNHHSSLSASSSSTSRRRKRRRTEVVEDEEEIDDDDLALVAENTGLAYEPAASDQPQYKRIKRRKDRDAAGSDVAAGDRGSRGDYYGNDDPNDGNAGGDLGIWADNDAGDGYDDEDDDAGFIMYDNEEQADVDPTRYLVRAQKQRPRTRPTGYEPSYETHVNLMETFGDGTEYDWVLDAAQQAEDERNAAQGPGGAAAARGGYHDGYDDEHLDGMGEIKLTDVFEHSEVAGKMLTEKDDEIRVIDIPERLQVTGLADKLLEGEFNSSVTHVAQAIRDRRRRKADAAREAGQSMDDSDEWTFPDRVRTELRASWEADRMRPEADPYGAPQHYQARQAPIRTFRDEDLDAAVRSVLSYLRRDLFEVPYIVVHCRDYWAGSMTEGEVWFAADEDGKHSALFAKRQTVATKAEKVGAANDADFSSALLSLEPADIRDANDYLDFFYGETLANLAAAEAGSTFRPPKRLTEHSFFNKQEVTDLIRDFTLTPTELEENARTQTTYNMPASPSETVEDALRRVATRGVTYEKYQNAFVKYMAQRLFHSPVLRQFYRRTLQMHGKLYVDPTENAVDELQPGHKFFGVKYIHNKKLSEARNDPEFCLLVHEGEQQGKLRVKVQLSGETESTFRERMRQAWNPRTDGSGVDWADIRGMIWRDADILLYNHAAGAIHDQLISDAHDQVLRACRAKLFEIAHTRPFDPSDVPRQNSRIPQRTAQEYPRTLGLTVAMSGRDYMVVGALTDNVGLCVEHFVEPFQLERFAAIIQRTDARVVVVESTRSMSSLRLYELVMERVKEARLEDSLTVEMIEDHVAAAYSNSAAAKSEFPDFTPPLRKAVGLARQMQDPQHLTASLFPDAVVHLDLHPRQGTLTQETLRVQLELALVQSVMVTGVDINAAAKHAHLAHTLQFVAGLGPRKVVGLLPRLQKLRNVSSRNVFVRQQLMGARIFTNSVAFFRIDDRYVDDRDLEPLDGTRIHLEDYRLARKIASDALGMHEIGDANSQAVLELFNARRGYLVEQLSLDTYAEVLYEKSRAENAAQGKDGMHKLETLWIIKNELQVPYEEMRPVRRSTASLAGNEKLALLFGPQAVQATQVRSLVSAKVNRVMEKLVRCTLVDTGIDAILFYRDVFPEDKGRQLTETMHEGDVITGVVREVDFERVCVSLVMTPEAVEQARTEGGAQIRDPCFNRDKWAKEFNDRKERARLRELYTTSGNLGQAIPAAVQHPLFRPFNKSKADRYLADKPPGEAVIRPSSRPDVQLVVSWVVLDGIVQHVDVTYDAATKKFQLLTSWAAGDGQPPKLANSFHDLDEILFRYVQACSAQVEKVRSFRKFVAGSEDHMFGRLSRDVAANPKIAAYALCADPRSPGAFMIGFQYGAQKPSRVGFRVVPQGFMFLDREYTAIEGPGSLINAFKNAISQPPPQQQQQHMPPPMAAHAAMSHHHSHAYPPPPHISGVAAAGAPMAAARAAPWHQPQHHNPQQPMPGYSWGMQ